MFAAATRPRLGITATGARLGATTFNGDGSYTTTIDYPLTTRPSLRVRIDGADVVRTIPLAPIATLTFVNVVREYKLGNEAEKGINRHPNPKDALGDIAARQRHRVVATGAFGCAELRIEVHTILPG